MCQKIYLSLGIAREGSTTLKGVAVLRETNAFTAARLGYTLIRCETSYSKLSALKLYYINGGARLQNGGRGKTAISERQNYLKQKIKHKNYEL